MDVIMNRGKALVLGLSILLAAALAISGFHAKLFTNKKVPGDSISASSNSLRHQLNPNFEALATRIGKSVVNISVERDNSVAFHTPSDSLSGIFDSFDLINTNNRAAKRTSPGSGFVVSPDGYILTNSHIIDNASAIRVEFKDRRSENAILVGTDPETDLAVLKVDGSNWPFLNLAKSDTVARGDWVVAFGSPFGADPVITAGIAGGNGHFFASRVFSGPLQQTDAFISPENSGGPLVNLQGDVIGVNLSIDDRSRLFSGMGFAVPASSARKAYSQIIQNGRSTRGWMGVSIQDITPTMARVFGLIAHNGVLVAYVCSESPAAKAGLQGGDIILEYNHQPVHSSTDLSTIIAHSRIGLAATLTILRNRARIPIDVLIGERLSTVAKHFSSAQTDRPGTLGIMVEDITADIQAQMQLPSRSGILIVDVSPDSLAESDGLRPGDIIREINHSPANSAVALMAAIRNSRVNGPVLLGLERRGMKFFAAFDLNH
jgi:serine protease Do